SVAGRCTGSGCTRQLASGGVEGDPDRQYTAFAKARRRETSCDYGECGRISGNKCSGVLTDNCWCLHCVDGFYVSTVDVRAGQSFHGTGDAETLDIKPSDRIYQSVRT